MGAGKAHPTGPSQENDPTSSSTTSHTFSGVPGFGVGSRRRLSASVPVLKSTGAAFMPLPPMSIPNAVPMAVSYLACRKYQRPSSAGESSDGCAKLGP